jgi:hypothetical protein
MSNWKFNKEQNEIVEINTEKVVSICAINSNEPNWLENGHLIASSPELLNACQNALKDVQKLNKQLIEEGNHGYILMENELNEAIKLALGS